MAVLPYVLGIGFLPYSLPPLLDFILLK